MIGSLAATSSDNKSAHVLQPSSTFSLLSSLSTSSGRFLIRIVANLDNQDYLDNPEYKLSKLVLDNCTPLPLKIVALFLPDSLRLIEQACWSLFLF